MGYYYIPYQGMLPQLLMNTGDYFQGLLPEVHVPASLGTVFFYKHNPTFTTLA